MLSLLEVGHGETSVVDDTDEDDDNSVFHWRAGFLAELDGD